MKSQSEKPERHRFLFERVGLYFILVAILVLVSSIILILPYSHTYLMDYGADEFYLRSFIMMAVASSAIMILGIFYNLMIWMEGRGGDSETTLPKSVKLLRSSKSLLKAIFSRAFGKNLRIFLRDTILLAKLWRTSRSRWFFHALILYGFLGMFILDIISTIALDIFSLESFTEQNGWGKLWIRDFGFDMFGLMMLVGLLAASGRRFIVRPRQLVTGYEDILSILLLLVVILSGFIIEGVGIASGIPGHESQQAYSFMGSIFAAVLPAVTVSAYSQLWMIHAVLSLAFIIYIPFSKLFHLFAAPLAIQVNYIIERRDPGPEKRK